MFRKILMVPIPCALCSGVFAAGGLEENFINPPDSAKSSCYWWWLNANVDKEAIARDMDLSHDKKRATKTLHRLVMGHGWWLLDATLLPHGFMPTDALYIFGFRVHFSFQTNIDGASVSV
jgi:hypothetical protein